MASLRPTSASALLRHFLIPLAPPAPTLSHTPTSLNSYLIAILLSKDFADFAEISCNCPSGKRIRCCKMVQFSISDSGGTGIPACLPRAEARGLNH